MAGESSWGFSSLQLKRKLRARRMRPLTTVLVSCIFSTRSLNMFFNLVPDHFRGLDGGECFNGCVCHCFVLLFFYSVLLFVKVFPSFLYCFRILICRKGTGWQSICLHTIKQFIQITSVTHSAGKRRASFRKIWYNSFIKNGGILENGIINFDGDAERRYWIDRLD